ncbi:MAG TPA: NUDIX domain-containing protein [Chitinispirillaceae bacterium]|nr:NUDIX domain-containing protein [Chitinispirillaceae bacterium]
MLNFTKFTYCPKCGKESLNVLEQNGMICKSCGLKYYHNTAAAVAGIIVSPKGIVMIKRAHDPGKGKLDIPGGFANYHETLEDALRRELFEELNISVTNYRYITSFPNEYQYAGITYFTIDTMFLVQWNETFTIVPNDEIDALYYVDDPQGIDFDTMAFQSTRKIFSYLIENHLQ